eukprot:3733009-Prymnesium_polylepis.2
MSARAVDVGHARSHLKDVEPSPEARMYGGPRPVWKHAQRNEHQQRGNTVWTQARHRQRCNGRESGEDRDVEETANERHANPREPPRCWRAASGRLQLDERGVRRRQRHLFASDDGADGPPTNRGPGGPSLGSLGAP